MNIRVGIVDNTKASAIMDSTGMPNARRTLAAGDLQLPISKRVAP